MPKQILLSFFKKQIYLFIYFWLRWVFVAARGLSLVEANGGYSSLWCTGFSLRWLLLLRSTGCRCVGFSSGTRAQQLWLVGSRVQAQQLWCTDLVAPRHVESSQTRAQTRVPCILAGRFLTTAPLGKSAFFFFFLKDRLSFCGNPALLDDCYHFKKIFIYLLIYFAAPGVSCGTWDLQLWHANSQLRHVGSSSLTRD